MASLWDTYTNRAAAAAAAADVGRREGGKSSFGFRLLRSFVHLGDDTMLLGIQCLIFGFLDKSKYQDI